MGFELRNAGHAAQAASPQADGGLAAAWSWIETNSAAIQAVCVVLSAVAAFAVIGHAGRISRREKTIDMVKDTLLNEDGTGPYTAFNNALEQMDGRDIAELFERKPEDRAIVDVIDQQLNVYELIALGIRRRVFEETFYWLWFRSQLLRDYDQLRPYINRLRKELAPTVASEFRWLAIRWKKRTAPDLYPTRWKMAAWALTGKRQRLLQALNADDPVVEDKRTSDRLAQIRKDYMRKR